SQLLACVQWLGEFQVLAYLPLEADQGLPIQDMAELADVPEAQLCRIVRLTAMGGFLREPQPGYVAHTALSASFVRRLAQLDSAMFLAETVAPCMLHMAAASRHAHTHQAEGLAMDWGSKRVQRLWSSFVGAMGGADQDSHILAQIDWASLARDAAPHPALRFVVQTTDAAPPPSATATVSATSATASATSASAAPTPPSHSTSHSHNHNHNHHHNVRMCQRAHGAPQTITDAALYLVRVPANIPGPIRPRIAAELRAHLPVLQAQRGALLILTSPLLPEPGTVSRQTELLARVRDLARLQLVGSGLLTLQELVELVGSIHDAHGGLVVVKQLHAPNSAFVGLGLRYQPLLPLTG
ncbi:uncharacterized protein SETTUDRAFT_111323, partial [Exserohilum turcica Et28A]